MKIAIGSDHRGFEAKRKILPLLRTLGHDVQDYGCLSTASCDYPDFACAVGKAVAAGKHEIGILFDGSGIGMGIAANKVRGIFAATVHDEVTARRSREQNHCNVLCIGCDLLGGEQIRKIVETFVSSNFIDGRHIRRVEKVKQIEQFGLISDPLEALGSGDESAVM